MPVSDLAEKRVLLVEDEEDEVALTLRALRGNGINCQVQTVNDGAQALGLLLTPEADAASQAVGKPDLILLDLKLPKVDGLEVLRCLKRDPRTQPVPVVVLTTSIEFRDLEQAYALGTNSYLRKPVDYAEFKRLIGEMARYWLQLNQPLAVDESEVE